MRHFVAYHNTEKMGHALADGDARSLVTNKSVKQLYQNVVWFITGEGDKRKYSLGSVFHVAEVGASTEEGFRHIASGQVGHTFEPPVPIQEMDWFPEIMRITGRFGFGVQPLSDEQIIAKLVLIAKERGFDIDAKSQPPQGSE